MKNRKAFSLIELLVCIAIFAILLAMLLPQLVKVKQQAEQQRNGQVVQSVTVPAPSISIGDTIYIDGLDITGKVNQIYPSGNMEILIKGTNGVPQTITGINPVLLKRVNPTVER